MSTKPLTAAFVCEYPSLNGGEYSLLAALPYLQQHGISPVAITPPRGPLVTALSLLGIRTQAVTWYGSEGHRLPQPMARANLAAAIRKVSPGLVHANSLSISRLLGPIAAELGVPSIGHIRDIVRLSRQAVADLNRLSRILAVSQATRNWHVTQGVEPQRIVVHYNGVDLDKFQPHAASGSLRRELGLDSPSRFVATIGQLGLRKGMDLVLESAQSLADEFPDVHWVVVGERHSEKAEAVDFERRLHQMAASPPLLGRVHFLGRREVAPLLDEMSVVILASRQEPLGRILLESAAAGRAIIATRVGGTEEIFPQDSQTAQLVPPENSAAITSELRGLLLDPTAAARLGMNARRHMAGHFDVAKRGPELAKHYREVAGVD